MGQGHTQDSQNCIPGKEVFMSKRFISIMGGLLFLLFLLVSPVCVSADSESGGDRLNVEPNTAGLKELEYQLPKRLPTIVQPEGERSQSDHIDEPADGSAGTQVPMSPEPPSDRVSYKDQ
jgi:hypothetical protein